MRIAHVLNDVHEAGNGIINVTVDLACGQRALGHDVSVLSAGGEFERLLADHGVDHVRLDQARRPANLARALVALRRHLDAIDPDVVHAHTMTAVVLARLARLWPPRPGLERRRFLLSCSVHNTWQRSSSIMALGDAVIAVSDADRSALLARRFPSARLFTVRNGPVGSVRRSSPEQIEPAPLERPSIVTVAGMYRRKGIADLIAAFTLVAPDHPGAHLYLVGEGPDRADFERQATEAGLADRIHFTGFQREPGHHLVAADIFVLASHSEPISLVVPEARAAGCAIVASDAGGIVEALDGGRAGVVFPAGDVDALAAALRRLLSDRSELERWQAAARLNLDWLRTERMVAEILGVYEKALAA